MKLLLLEFFLLLQLGDLNPNYIFLKKMNLT
nr:MAG TPA: hypothetical protein [Caudoviricetes sp.]DAW66082.1 MAG TPA: hypothetical protein [Caudoviricetes sp.]